MSNLKEIIKEMAHNAKKASYKLGLLSSIEKNRALEKIADALTANKTKIKSMNAIDVRDAQLNGLSDALIDRLTLTDARIDAMIEGVRQIAAQPDPIGRLITEKTLENGIMLRKIRVPLGVIGIVFESRPNIISDVVALCLKSGNAVILRGGKEALQSNKAIMDVIDEAIMQSSLPGFSAQMVALQDKEAVKELCQQEGLIDVIIPRGGENLMRAVIDCAKIPVIKHYKGVCHCYIDKGADLKMAVDICINAKCQRPGVCNAIEKILIHEEYAPVVLRDLVLELLSRGVEIRGCEKAASYMPTIKRASAEDWSAEYLDLIVAIKIVKDVEHAIDHINTYGSKHSDAIISNDTKAQSLFTQGVDSAAVYVNASTRFTDGGVFGLGGEMGISTDKLHARGPMGAFELTSYKWIGIGRGQVRS